MKKRIFAVLMAVCMMIGTSAMAQQHNGENKQKATPEQIAQRKTEQMKKVVDLTDAQAKQIYNFNLEVAKSKLGDKQQMAADRKARMEKLKSILTPEQYAKWIETQKTQRHQYMKGNDGCAKAGACSKKADSCCDKAKGCQAKAKGCQAKADSKCKSECKKK